LGLNFGRLTRLLALAERLKTEGHVVLVAARDIQAATRVPGPAGIPFVQAPLLAQGIPLEHRPASYADVLLTQGWLDKSLLSGLVYAWLALFRLFRAERLVLAELRQRTREFAARVVLTDLGEVASIVLGATRACGGVRMSVRSAALALVIGLASITLAQAKSPPSAPPPRYSAGQIGEMFERPATDEQLLRNLKVAFDKGLIAEPAFAANANLLRIFAGLSVSRKPQPPVGNRVDEMSIVVTVDDSHLPRMTVTLSQWLGKFDEAGKAAFGPPARIIRVGHLDIDFPARGRATVADVRRVFDKETQAILANEWVSESDTDPVRPSKGYLFYGDPRDAQFVQAALDRKRAVFFLDTPDPKRPPHAKMSLLEWAHTILETDTVAHLSLYVPVP
jgi:hypothetical protein